MHNDFFKEALSIQIAPMDEPVDSPTAAALTEEAPVNQPCGDLPSAKKGEFEMFSFNSPPESVLEIDLPTAADDDLAIQGGSIHDSLSAQTALDSQTETSEQHAPQPRYPIPTFYLDSAEVSGLDTTTPRSESRSIRPGPPMNNILPSAGLLGTPVDPTEIEVSLIKIYINIFH